MKILIIFLFFYLHANADIEKFHPPKTEAEKTLDMILKKQMKEERAFYTFLTDFSNLENSRENHEYYNFFTKHFVHKIRKMEEDLCDTKTRALTDMKCTIDVNPITQNADDGHLHASTKAKLESKQISQIEWTGRRHKVNFSSNIFLYKSFNGSNKRVFIEQAWVVDERQVTLFEMKKEDGKWKIDDAIPKR